jgi:glycine cleavage system T protein (aminomethyltransferase)
LEMVDRGIARDGYGVFNESGVQIGSVVSGSPAPFLRKNIALAFIPKDYSAVDRQLFVQVRNSMAKAKMVPIPFYRRPKKQS